jgi:hypothetical protein
MQQISHDLIEARRLLRAWMSRFESRSYTSIRDACVFLNESMHLGIDRHPALAIFGSLVNTGVADFCGNDHYSLTEPLAIVFQSHAYLVNCLDAEGEYGLEDFPGVCRCPLELVPNNTKTVRLTAPGILKSVPCVRDVVDSWDSSLQDESRLEYSNCLRKGVARLTDGQSRYFSIPEKVYLKDIPPRSVNPDAYQIAVSLERAVTGECSGTYDRRTRSLTMKKYGLPSLIFKALLVSGMEADSLPEESGYDVTFRNISESCFMELNRIFCKTIRAAK